METKTATRERKSHRPVARRQNDTVSEGVTIATEPQPLPGTWREVLPEIVRLTDPLLLIVTRRLADEGLWAEAVNL
jgi:hypothetical protein